MINIPDEKLREGYWYVLQNPTGYLSDLEKIHPDLSDHFIQTNIIGEGMNSIGEPRYHLTDFGREAADIYERTITANLIRKKLDEKD